MKKIQVVAAVLKYKDKYFCAQRKNKGPLAMKWEFPGGKIEKGETKEEALIREIKEELLLDITIDKFIMTVEHQYETFHLTMHAYLCHGDTNNIKLIEHLNSKWLDKNNLENLDWAGADIPIVKRLIGE